MEILDIKMMVPIIKPKYANAKYGCFVVKGGKMFFLSEKNIVFVREHFPETGAAPEILVENTIRYDSENSSGTVETQGGVGYDIRVNDVL